MLYLLAVFVASLYSSVSAQCWNGGQLIAVGCTSSSQCAPYTKLDVTCMNGACCTVPSRCTNGGTAVALGCSQSQQCAQYSSQPVACVAGVCCTIPQRCSNGGTLVAVGCTSSQQCVPFASGVPVACFNGGLCCTTY